MITNTYTPNKKLDLRELAAKKLGPVGENYAYFGEIVRGSIKADIYHFNDTTAFLTTSHVSFSAISREKIEKAKKILETQLEVQFI